MWKKQRQLIDNPSAKYLAVRRVTQNNRGKNTGGVDGTRAYTPVQRMQMVQSLDIDGKADTVKRVFIPKSTPGEMRSLGIPTIKDRAKQAVNLLALEPQWQAQFEADN